MTEARAPGAGGRGDLSGPFVLTTLHPGWRVLALNRPERLNAFTEAMHADLRAALDAAEADPATRCVVLTGAGRGFCAGQDLNDRVSGDSDARPDLSETIHTLWNPLLRRLRKFPMPVIAAVNGVAAGAGANLALACDLVVAAKSAKFLQAFMKIGLVPDSGGTWTLPRLVGRARAYGLAALAEPLPAAEAAAMGLIWKAVGDDVFEAEVADRAARLASGPTGALVALREALDLSEANDFDAQLEVERRLQGRLGFAPDYAEGVAAFMEKRPPRFAPRGSDR